MSLIKSLGVLNSSGSEPSLPEFFVPGRLFNQDIVGVVSVVPRDGHCLP
jgi:hypothetical protein